MRRFNTIDFTMLNLLKVAVIDNNFEADVAQKHCTKACSDYCDILTEVGVVSLVVRSNGL